MRRSILLGIVFLFQDCSGQNSIELDLENRIKFEILWGDHPTGFSMPPGNVLESAIYRSQTRVAYCSARSLSCAAYDYDEVAGALGDRFASRPCCVNHGNSLDSARTALQSFVSSFGDAWPTPAALASSRRPIVWSAALSISARSKVIEEYRTLPCDCRKVSDVIRMRYANSEYRELSIARFKVADSLIHLLGIRGSGKPILIVLRNRPDWDFPEAGIRDSDLDLFAATIKSLVCTRIEFDKE